MNLYATRKIRGQEQYSCFECNYDTSNMKRIEEHIKKHPQLFDPRDGMTHGEWIASQDIDPEAVRGRKVALCLLTWNHSAIISEQLSAHYQEMLLLRKLGNEAIIIICDNGSTDGTGEFLSRTATPDTVIRNPRNFGISVARNQMITYALRQDCDYILFVDGDIEIIPFSSYALMRHLEAKEDVGCMGFWSASYTEDRARASDHCYTIPERRIHSDTHTAWTQYGLFRADMFRSGIWFEEAGPFGGPGWGLEDDDLYFQMAAEEWRNCYCKGYVYLHRRIRSSVSNLAKAGMDPKAIFNARKAFLQQKWGKDPQVTKRLAPLNMPKVEVYA